MHELHIIFEVKLSCFKSFLLIFDKIGELAGFLFFYVNVHFGEIDFFFLVEEVMQGLFFLYVRDLYLWEVLAL